MLLLEAYADDSGKESQKDRSYAVLACFVQPSNGWDEFNREWSALLTELQIEALHMRVWVKLCRERNWDERTANENLLRFIAIIRAAKFVAFGAGLDLNLWRSTRKSLAGKIKSAEVFLMVQIIKGILDGFENKIGELELNFVFDQDEGFAKDWLRAYFELKSLDGRVGRLVPIISFADHRRCLALQAADLLAWLSRRRMIERSEGQPPGEVFMRLTEPLADWPEPFDWREWTDRHHFENEFSGLLGGAEGIDCWPQAKNGA